MIHRIPIEVPEQVHELLPVVSVSGGKDSTAVCLALKEAGIEHRRVFADTGWEHSSTYEHLDTLRKHLGPIDVVGVEGGMVERARYRAGFPSRMARWCTRELKLAPLREYHNAIERETVSVVGVRAEESPARARFAEFEDDDTWDGYVWRPILRWSVDDVLAIHLRHDVPLHPLYHHGLSRVGCWPCIFSRKEELRMIADIDPARIALIRKLEQEMTELRAERNAKTPGRYTYPQATFFQAVDRVHINGIDDVVRWARTARGGRQFALIPDEPSGGCYRWGLCEPNAPRE